MSHTLAQARAADDADPLRGFRDHFTLPDGVIYLDGNSLGAPPRATLGRVDAAITHAWGEGLIRSWNDADWIGAPTRIGGKIARLIGAGPGEVVAADSTSVNLFKLLAAGVRARPGRPVILTETGNFPTDLYIAQGVAASLPGVEVRAVARAAVAEAIGADVAVVMLTHVHYKSAERWDMAAITARAHAAGALVLWDLSHSAGAIEVDLRACDADLAVGCGYKFLNGGPGAPAFLFVAERLQARLQSPLSGWMGHAAAFDFSDDYRPAAGVARFLCGTPAVLGLTALEVGVDIALAADMDVVSRKSAALWALFAGLVEEGLSGYGLELISPRDPAARGSHISFTHPEGYRIMQALIARGVIGDFRDPDVLRFGLTPLYLGSEDVWRAVDILREVMRGEAWRAAPPRAAGRVT
jgi:kynureninase